MSLHFDKVTLEDFGPYKGVQTVELTSPPDVPITMIYGENTLGKTQLFSALRWCLYGSFQAQQTVAGANNQLRSRLNKIAERAGKDSFAVSISFRAGDQTYNLVRRATFSFGGQERVTVDLRIDASVIPTGQISSEIGKLLHPQISEFFLFDGELLSRFYERLNTDRERTLIRQTIDSVLGIPALQRAKTDLFALSTDALDRQAKASKNQTDGERFRRTLQGLKNTQDSLEIDRSETAERLERADAELQDRRGRLKLVEGLQADVREQELIESQMADGERAEAALRAEMRTVLSTGWLSIAQIRVADMLKNVQDRNSVVQKQERRISEARQRLAVLEDRSRGGTCPVCEQSLPEPDASTPDELVAAQMVLRKLVGDAGAGAVDLMLERRVGGLLDRASASRYCDLQRSLDEVLVLQYDRKRRLEGIADRLEGNSAADIRVLAAETRRLEIAVKTAQSALADIEQRLKTLASDQQKAARQLSRVPSVDADVGLEAGFFSYVDGLYAATIDRYRERVRVEVETTAAEMFLQLIRDPGGYGGLRVSSDYKIDILDRHDARRDTSEGGRQLLALALIGALKLAAVRGGPVVIDSPLGRLDLEHRANVLQTWVPRLGSQAVLLVQSGELTIDSARHLVGGLIQHEYRIVRPGNDPEYAVIERVDS